MRNSSTALTSLAALALVACGKSADDAPASAAAAPAAAEASPAASTAAVGDPCSLVADAAALFAQQVTAERTDTPNGAPSCTWKSADGRICGSVQPLGPGWHPSADGPTTFAMMQKSMGAFGEVKPHAGIGDEAAIVEAGMFGVQLAVRKGDVVALTASACSSGSLGPKDLADRLAKEIAPKL